MSTVFLIRIDRLPPEVKRRLQQRGPLEFTEVATRRWHVERGDELVFSDGYRDKLRFLGTGTVAEVRAREVPREADEQPAFEVGVSVEKIELFSEPRQLDQFMYSLQQVANLARPSLHFRHHVRLSRDDLETLSRGRFSEMRSVYYGLLRYLPSLWRDYLQMAARLRALSQLDLTRSAALSEPITSQLLRNLVDLLDELAIAPAEFAADIAEARRRSGVEHPEAWVRDENGHEWNMERFLSLAELTRQRGTIALWTRIRDTAATATDSELDTQIIWRPPLVNDIHRLSRDLGRICSLLPGQDPLALLSGKKPTAHFLFEVKVLWCLIERLADNQWGIVPVGRGGRFVYAMAPAAKRNVSYYVISYDTQSYHLVHGAEITDTHGQPRAPDVSLQSQAGGDQPTYEHVLAIWDAKLKGTTGAPTPKRVTDAEFARFAKVREWLCVPRPGDPRDILASWPAAFQVSAIITNGQPPSEPDSVFLECSVSVVKEFQSADSPCAPLRADQLAHIAAKAGAVATPTLSEAPGALAGRE